MIGETDSLARRGLEILGAKPGPKGGVVDVSEHDLTGELRERYWIRQAADAGVDVKTSMGVGFAMPLEIERAELGRTRSEPGDGFRYVFRGGIGRMGGRAEWFEVTEVFEGVEAKDIEAFMRLENGGKGYPGFDPEGFVRGLNFGIPRRAAQQRAADKVIAAVEKKLTKSSYEGLWRPYGYGTLIVGLPLWFAAYPLDPATGRKCRRRLHDTRPDRSSAARAATAEEKLPLLADRDRLERVGGKHTGVDRQGETGLLSRPHLLGDGGADGRWRVDDAAATRSGGKIRTGVAGRIHQAAPTCGAAGEAGEQTEPPAARRGGYANETARRIRGVPPGEPLDADQVVRNASAP